MTASPCPDNLHDEAASSPMQSALFGMIFEDGDASSGRRAGEEVLEMLFDDDHAPQTTEESNEEELTKGDSWTCPKCCSMMVLLDQLEGRHCLECGSMMFEEYNKVKQVERLQQDLHEVMARKRKFLEDPVRTNRQRILRSHQMLPRETWRKYEEEEKKDKEIERDLIEESKQKFLAWHNATAKSSLQWGGAAVQAKPAADLNDFGALASSLVAFHWGVSPPPVPCPPVLASWQAAAGVSPPPAPGPPAPKERAETEKERQQRKRFAKEAGPARFAVKEELPEFGNELQNLPEFGT